MHTHSHRTNPIRPIGTFIGRVIMLPFHAIGFLAVTLAMAFANLFHFCCGTNRSADQAAGRPPESDRRYPAPERFAQEDAAQVGTVYRAPPMPVIVHQPLFHVPGTAPLRVQHLPLGSTSLRTGFGTPAFSAHNQGPTTLRRRQQTSTLTPQNAGDFARTPRSTVFTTTAAKSPYSAPRHPRTGTHVSTQRSAFTATKRRYDGRA